uniref:Secreted protein n=1 Tax=Caenorhabditis tropicalis TaxID=1561998 RepID=A0A1I7URD4_9PELO
MGHLLTVILALALLIEGLEAATKAPKFSRATKKTVNKLVNCLTPVDTVLAAKTADCEDSVCVSSAKQYAQRRYPQQYQSTVVPCLSSTTTLSPVTEKLRRNNH